MASASVNKPTNNKVKEQDINQKLQLFGIYSAFANGKVPTNKQIDVAMNSALASRPLAKPSTRLSKEGQTLVADLRDVIERSKLLLLTKNEGNLIQDFIYQCTQATAGEQKKPTSSLDKATAQQHGNEALEGLRTLGQLLISNGQFRKLLKDASILIRDMAGDGAQNAANKFKPSEDQLGQIDRPADDNTWHDVPDLSAKNIKGQMKDTYEKHKPKKDGDDTTSETPVQENTDKAAVQSTTSQKNKSSISSSTKAKGREALDKSKEYLDKKMPKERRDQTIWRMKKMIVEIQGHQDYQRAVDTLLRLAETYQGHSKDVAGQSADSAKGLQAQFKPLLTSIQVLVERFANSTSMDDLFDSINQIYKDADQDPELRNWFKTLDSFIRRCLKEQGYVMQDAANNEWKGIYDKGNFLLRERYRNHTNRVVDEVKFLADQFEQDPQNKAFGDAFDKLFKDLGNDEQGKPVFKKHLVKDLSSVILPAFFENVRYIPIPRIEYSDAMADAVIENLVIEGDNLAPNMFEFSSDNYFKWGRKQEQSRNKNKVMMSVSGIQMDLRDVSYYVNKKKGFPSVKDKGVMDIFLGGSGFSFKAAMETADKKDRNHFFKVNNVEVDIKHMDIKLKQSSKKLLFGLVKPLMFRLMNPILKKVVAAQIKQQIDHLDAIAWEIHQDALKMERQAKNNPEDNANTYQRHFQAFQNWMTQNKEQKQKEQEKKGPADEKKVNVAMTQHDSIFKDVTLPSGISNKATEYKDLAAKGDKWESPVFTIGSSKESTNIPKIGQIQRKPHNVTPSEVRGIETMNSSTQPNGIMK